MAEEKVLEKIRKLLERANDERGSTEGERETAMRMATSLMAKYQLDMADIPQAQREKDDPLGRFDGEGWYLKWCQMIRNSVAHLFDCRYVNMGKVNATRGRYTYIGRASNATTAMLMADWIVKDALREADRVGGHRLSAQGRSFGFGFAERLHARVALMRAQAAEEIKVSTGRDLVLIRTDFARENADFMAATMNIKPGKAITTRNLHADAMNAGRDAADRVNLSKQIKAPEATRSIK
jgi:hypothetical protein